MEHEQLGTLIRREYRRMVNYIRARVNSVSEMDAEDFVQDVLVSVLERADPALPLENLAAYVYRSLRNRVIDFFRTRKPNVTLEGRGDGEDEGLKAVLKDVGPDSLARLGAQEMEAFLFKAMESLKPMEQDVIMAHALEGVSFRELSEAWNVPVNTLLSHKSRGMARLKEYFLKNEASS